MTAAFQHKRGDSFVAQCQYLDDNEDPEDFVALGITVRSQVRTQRGDLVSTLVVTLGSLGAYQLADATTADWPLGVLNWDIQYTSGSTVFSTETLEFEVVKDVTL